MLVALAVQAVINQCGVLKYLSLSRLSFKFGNSLNLIAFLFFDTNHSNASTHTCIHSRWVIVYIMLHHQSPSLAFLILVCWCDAFCCYYYIITVHYAWTIPTCNGGYGIKLTCWYDAMLFYNYHMFLASGLVYTYQRTGS